jgi:hypothetical protein
MSPRTFIKPREAGSLKDAVAALIEACGGVSKVRCRVKKTVLQEYADNDKPARHMPLDIVQHLEAQCGNPIVTRFLALSNNCLLEQAGDQAREPTSIVLGRMTEDQGRILAAAAEDVRDGKLTRTNAEIVLRATDDMVPALIELRAAARAAIVGER